jgi:hypothetical protein
MPIVGEEPLGRVVVLGLHLEPAELVHALRGEAEVAHHRDAGLGHAGCQLDDAPGALDLDGGRARLLEEAGRVAQALVGRALVGHEGHGADDEGALAAAGRSSSGSAAAGQRHPGAHWIDGLRHGCITSETTRGIVVT